MSVENEELAIAVIAETQAAKKDIKELIREINGVQQSVKNAIDGAKGLGQGFSNAFSNIDFKGARSTTRQVESYLKASAKDMAKNLILTYEIDDKEAQATIRNLSQQITELSFEAGKNKKMTGSQGIFGDSALTLHEQLVNLVSETYQVKDATKAAETTWQDFYNTIIASQKINIGEKGLEEIQYALGQWQHLDGLIKRRFSSKEGISLDSVWSEWDKDGKLSSLGEEMGLDASNAANHIHIVVEALKQYREEMDALPKADKDSVIVDSWNMVAGSIKEVDALAKSMFLTADEQADKFRAKMEEVRHSLGNTGKDFATKGGNFNSIESIEKAIEGLQQKIYNLQTRAQTVDIGSEEFKKSAKKAVIYENQIESLKERLAALNNMPQFNPNVLSQSALDAIDRLFEDQEQLTEEVEETAAAYKDLSDEVAKVSASGGVSSSANSTKEMATAAEETKSKYSLLGNVIESVKGRLSGVTKGFASAMKITVPTKEFTEIQGAIDATRTKLDKLKAQMERGLATNKDFSSTTTFKKLKYDIEEAENSIKAFKADLDDLGTHTHRLNWEGIGANAKKAFGQAGNAIKVVTSHIRSLAKAVGSKISSAFSNLGKSMSKVDLTSKGLVKSFLKVSNMLKLMITRMALRGVINEAKEGFKELIAFSDRTADSYNKIRNAIAYLANTLAALTAPILNASGTFAGLGNIIDAIADKIVDLINKINQLMSALLGHGTWIKASKGAKNYAADVNKAGKAAKGALASFDELNNITTNDNGGGGAGGAGGGGFQELPIDDKWKNMAKWLKDMWKKADLTDLGTFLGEKLRDALNNIPWEKIQNEARKMGKRLATLLNGFLEVPGLPESIGNTIAQAINTALAFVTDFVKNFHFDSLGRFIGMAIVTAVRKINWDELKSTASLLGEKLAQFFNSLVGTGVIREIGTAFGNVLRAAINFGFKLVTNIKFDVLGKELLIGINRFFDSMGEVDEDNLNGWQKLGKTIGDGLKGVLTAINTVLGDADTRKRVGEAITDFLNGLDLSGIVDGLGELIGNLAALLAEVIVSALRSDSFRKGLLKIVPYLLAGFGAVFTGNSLKAGLANLGKQLAPKIGVLLSNGLSGLGSFMTADIGTSLAAGGATAGATIGGAIAGSAVAAIGGMEIGKKIGAAIFPDDAELYEKYSGITGTFEMLGETFVTLGERTAEHAANAWSAIKDGVSSLAETIANSALAAKIIEIRDTFISSWQAIANFFAPVVESIKYTAGAAFDWMAAKIMPIVGAIKAKFESDWQGILNIANTVHAALKTAVQTAYDFIESHIFSKLLAIQDKCSQIWENVKTIVSEKVKAAVDTVINLFAKLGQFFIDLSTKARTWGENLMKGLTSGIIAGRDWVANAISSIGDKFRTNTPTTYRRNADGGIYVNGKWKPVQHYASGGLPNTGQMFVAREKGAELVGNIGGNTAVMNNDQIVASVSAGVYRAVVSAMANAPSSQTNVYLEGDAAKLFRVVRKEGNDYQRRTGNPVFA